MKKTSKFFDFIKSLKCRLIVWAILSIVYYDVWNYVTVNNPHFGMWYTYIPPVCYSIGAGIGTYFLLKSFKRLNRVTITKAEDKKTKKKK